MFKFLVYLKLCGKILILCLNESTGNPKGSYLVKHPYWAVRLTKICDNSQSDYLPSISRLVTHATRLTLNSIIPNILEIILVH